MKYMAVAMINVAGKADPNPKGAMEIKKTIAPNAPNLNTSPFIHIEIAMHSWQIAIDVTAQVEFSLNQPRINA